MKPVFSGKANDTKAIFASFANLNIFPLRPVAKGGLGGKSIQRRQNVALCLLENISYASIICSFLSSSTFLTL